LLLLTAYWFQLRHQNISDTLHTELHGTSLIYPHQTL
jgi:hypothetical protein